MEIDLPPRATPQAFARLALINAEAEQPRCLRVAVKGGGCSGFEYDIALVEGPEPDDMVLEGEGETAGQKILVDEVSLPFLGGAVIDWSEEIVGSKFVIENPNVVSSCGCGTSFAI